MRFPTSLNLLFYGLMKNTFRFATSFFFLFILAPKPASSQTIEWARQLGTTSTDWSYGVSADESGNVFITGYTRGQLGGFNNNGDDAFVSRYDSSGTLHWTRHVSTGYDERGRGIAADGFGGVYITGETYGPLGGANAGFTDAFVSKLNNAGNIEWTRQFGTSNDESGTNVSTDGLGSVYVSGYTWGNLEGINAGGYDAFLRKYDANGAVQWTRQLGTDGADAVYGVSADKLGNVFISGFSGGDLPGDGQHAFLTMYDDTGDLQWTQQFGVYPTDVAHSVVADGHGNVYVSGYTYGSLGGMTSGFYDAFLAKYDSTGAQLWSRQLGTTGDDLSLSVSTDGKGNVFIAGYTQHLYFGIPQGGIDGFFAKYDSDGNLEWNQPIATANWDQGQSVSVDGLGGVYISGVTNGPLGPPPRISAGSFDAFLVKANYQVPEPSTALMLLCIALAGSLRRMC
jgi:hypothetical protein